MVEEKMEEENEKIRKKDWRVSQEEKPKEGGNVKIVNNGLNFYFLLFTLFHFFFSFLFLEQLRLGFISHAVTSVTS